jgi:hypothetical protein
MNGAACFWPSCITKRPVTPSAASAEASASAMPSIWAWVRSRSGEMPPIAA